METDLWLLSLGPYFSHCLCCHRRALPIHAPTREKSNINNPSTAGRGWQSQKPMKKPQRREDNHRAMRFYWLCHPTAPFHITGKDNFPRGIFATGAWQFMHTYMRGNHNKRWCREFSLKGCARVFVRVRLRSSTDETTHPWSLRSLRSCDELCEGNRTKAAHGYGTRRVSRFA